MKPIAVFQHTEVGAPGTVPTILESLGREVRLVRIVDGEPVPSHAGEFGGLVFLGGSMAAHDDLPWIFLWVSTRFHVASKALQNFILIPAAGGGSYYDAAELWSKQP